MGIFDGRMAEKTNINVMISTLFGGTFKLRSSAVTSHWNAWQRFSSYSGLSWRKMISKCRNHLIWRQSYKKPNIISTVSCSNSLGMYLSIPIANWLLIIDYWWLLLLIIIDYYCFLLIIIDYHWLLLIIIDYYWLLLIIIDYYWLLIIHPQAQSLYWMLLQTQL